MARPIAALGRLWLLAALWPSRCVSAADKIYWTERGSTSIPGTLHRADAADFSNAEVLVTNTGTTKMNGVAIYEEGCAMFYAVESSPGTIMKAALDGAGATTFYTCGSGVTPNDLWIDTTNKRLWWTESKSKFYYASVDTGNAQYGVAQYVPSLNGNNNQIADVFLAVDTTNNQVYFGDPVMNTIMRQSAGATSASSEEFFVDSFLDEWLNVHVYVPSGLKVDTTTSKLVYADSSLGTVCQVPVPTTAGTVDEQVLISGLSGPAGIELVGTTLWIAEETGNKILKGTISGGSLTGTTNMNLGSGRLPRSIGFMDAAATDAARCFTTTTTTATSTLTSTTTTTTTVTTITVTTTTLTTTTTSTHTTSTTTSTISTTTTTTATTTTTTITSTTTTVTTTTTATETSTTTTETTTTSTVTATTTTGTVTTTTVSVTATTVTATSSTATSTTSTATTSTATTTITSTTTTGTVTVTTSTVTDTTTTATTTTATATSSTTTTTTAPAGVVISGSVVFTADGVTQADVLAAVQTVLENQLGVQAGQLSLRTSTAKRRLAEDHASSPRRLAATWISVYSATALTSVEALSIMKAAKQMSTTSAAFTANLKTSLAEKGASSVVVTAVAAPSLNIPANVFNGTTPCGASYCPAGRLPKLDADVDICSKVLTCVESQTECCMPGSDDTKTKTTTASSVVLIVALACVGGALCLFTAFVIIFMKRKRKEPRAQTASDARKKRAEEEDRFEERPQERLIQIQVAPETPTGQPAPAAPPVVPPQEVKKMDSVGHYNAVAPLPVRRGAMPDSEVLGQLGPGSEVEVVQVMDCLASSGVVMARIADPAGWVPLRDARGNLYLLRQQGTPAKRIHQSLEQDTAPPPIRQLEGEWRPYDRQGFRTKSVVKVDERGRVTVNGSRVLSEDLAVSGATVRRKNGWCLVSNVSTEDEILWSKPGEYSVIWKRAKPFDQFVAGEAVEWTEGNREVPAGSRGKVVGHGNGSVRVQFSQATLDVPSSDVLTVQASERDEQARAMLELLQGDWRLYDGDVMFPGIVTVSQSGYAMYSGMHWPEQDLLVLSGGVIRGDGWSVKMESSSSHDMLWCKNGEPSITWRRVKPASDYKAGEKVLWTEEAHNVPAGTVGTVVAITGAGAVRVAFNNTHMDLPPSQLLPADQPARPPAGSDAAVQLPAQEAAPPAAAAALPQEALAGEQPPTASGYEHPGTEARDILLSMPCEGDGSPAGVREAAFDLPDDALEMPVQVPATKQAWEQGQMRVQAIVAAASSWPDSEREQQQALSPAGTPSTGTPPVSPHLPPPTATQPFSTIHRDQEAASGTLLEVPPSGKAGNTTPSSEWGTSWLQVLTGPIGSGMSMLRAGQPNGGSDQTAYMGSSRGSEAGSPPSPAGTARRPEKPRRQILI